MDVRINTNPLSVDVLIDGDVKKSQSIDKDTMREYMYELCGDNDLLLEALRFCHRKLKVVSTTFMEVK